MWLQSMQDDRRSVFTTILRAFGIKSAPRPTGPIRSDTVFRASPSVRTACSIDRAALLDTDVGRALALDPVGTMIWQRIGAFEAGVNVDSILQHLSGVMGINPEDIREDITSYLQTLERYGLLRRNSNREGPDNE